jgi:antitoxin component of MazEF toxin-antitoxin module
MQSGDGQSLLSAIPQAVLEWAHFYPYAEVEFEMCASGEMVIRPIVSAAPKRRDAFTRVRGIANAPQLNGVGTDSFIAKANFRNLLL